MKWTNDPQAFYKAVYEAGTAFFEAANDFLDAVNDGLDDLEHAFGKCFESERSDDGAAAPTEDREAEVRRMMTSLVDHYSGINYGRAAASVWREALSDPNKVRLFVEKDNKYASLVNIYNRVVPPARRGG